MAASHDWKVECGGDVFVHNNDPFPLWKKKLTTSHNSRTRKAPYAVHYEPPYSSTKLTTISQVKKFAKDLSLPPIDDWFVFKVFCVCHNRENGTYFECRCGEGGCNRWFHPHCVGLDHMSDGELKTAEFICPLCTDYLKRRNELHRYVSTSTRLLTNGDSESVLTADCNKRFEELQETEVRTIFDSLGNVLKFEECSSRHEHWGLLSYPFVYPPYVNPADSESEDDEQEQSSEVRETVEPISKHALVESNTINQLSTDPTFSGQSYQSRQSNSELPIHQYLLPTLSNAMKSDPLTAQSLQDAVPIIPPSQSKEMNQLQLQSSLLLSFVNGLGTDTSALTPMDVDSASRHSNQQQPLSSLQPGMLNSCANLLPSHILLSQTDTNTNTDIVDTVSLRGLLLTPSCLCPSSTDSVAQSVTCPGLWSMYEQFQEKYTIDILLHLAGSVVQETVLGCVQSLVVQELEIEQVRRSRRVLYDVMEEVLKECIEDVAQKTLYKAKIDAIVLIDIFEKSLHEAASCCIRLIARQELDEEFERILTVVANLVTEEMLLIDIAEVSIASIGDEVREDNMTKVVTEDIAQEVVTALLTIATKEELLLEESRRVMFIAEEIATETLVSMITDVAKDTYEHAQQIVRVALALFDEISLSVVDELLEYTFRSELERLKDARATALTAVKDGALYNQRRLLETRMKTRRTSKAQMTKGKGKGKGKQQQQQPQHLSTYLRFSGGWLNAITGHWKDVDCWQLRRLKMRSKMRKGESISFCSRYRGCVVNQASHKIKEMCSMKPDDDDNNNDNDSNDNINNNNDNNSDDNHNNNDNDSNKDNTDVLADTNNDGLENGLEKSSNSIEKDENERSFTIPLRDGGLRTVSLPAYALSNIRRFGVVGSPDTSMADVFCEVSSHAEKDIIESMSGKRCAFCFSPLVSEADIGEAKLSSMKRQALVAGNTTAMKSYKRNPSDLLCKVKSFPDSCASTSGESTSYYVHPRCRKKLAKYEGGTFPQLEGLAVGSLLDANKAKLDDKFDQCLCALCGRQGGILQYFTVVGELQSVLGHPVCVLTLSKSSLLCSVAPSVPPIDPYEAAAAAAAMSSTASITLVDGDMSAAASGVGQDSKQRGGMTNGKDEDEVAIRELVQHLVDIVALGTDIVTYSSITSFAQESPHGPVHVHTTKRSRSRSRSLNCSHDTDNLADNAAGESGVSVKKICHDRLIPQQSYVPTALVAVWGQCRCSLCGSYAGFTLRCAEPKCYVRSHPVCAMLADLPLCFPSEPDGGIVSTSCHEERHRKTVDLRRMDALSFICRAHLHLSV